jgi:Leucine-rich repeat (LRR) protein
MSAKIQSDAALLKRIAGDPDSRTEQEKRNDDTIKVIQIKKLNSFKTFTLDELCIQLQLRFKNLEGLSISSADAATARISYLKKNEKINHIPDSICEFSKLTVLCLLGPILTLPERLGNLTNLTIFRLNTQKMLGTSPDPLPAGMRGRAGILLPESIGTLENLQTLECTSCNLQVIPPFVSGLSKLQVLTINDSSIREIPEMVLSERMNVLTITNSNLESLPESIGNLINLNTLILNSNRLTTLPSSIGNLTKLKTLELDHNQLTTLPPIKNPNALIKLILSHNQFESIPESMTDLSVLQTLDLSHNRITALPDNINKLTRLTYLFMNNNLLTTLPDHFGTILAGNNHPMEMLNFSHNNLTSIPASVGNLRNLTELSLEHNPNLRVLPAEVLNLSREGTEFFLHGTGVRANVQPQGPRVNAFQVHKEFAKIDIRSLFIFIARKVPREMLESELRTFDKTRVVATLRAYIVRMPLTEAEQKQLLDRLHAIYTNRLEGYRYDEDDEKVISYCMAYVAAQPERFQSEYARAFVEDCYDAYGNGSISCVKGVIERFVSTLRLAALLYDGTPEYNSREYGELASIIGHKKIGSLKERMNLISKECYEKSQNNNGNADETKFRKCMTDTLKAELGSEFNEKKSNTKNALNAVVKELNGMFGGRRVRRTYKKRKGILRKRTIKQKGKRKVRATRNKKRTHKRLR